MFVNEQPFPKQTLLIDFIIPPPPPRLLPTIRINARNMNIIVTIIVYLMLIIQVGIYVYTLLYKTIIIIFIIYR